MRDVYYSIVDFVNDVFKENGIKESPKVAIMGAIFSGFDGVGRVIELQAKKLSKTCDVTVIALEGDLKPPKGVKLKIIGAPKDFALNRTYRLLFPLNFVKLFKYARMLKEFDLVIAHQYPMTVLAYLAKRFFGVKYCYWHHHIPAEAYTDFYQKIYIKSIEYLDEKSWIIKNADYICSVSKFSRDLLRSKARIDSIVVYNEIDEEKFRGNVDGAVIRDKYRISKDDPVILYVGRIHPQKNVHTLLQVFKVVKRELPNAKLILVGKAIFGEYLDRLKSVSDDSVIFAGYVPDEELPYYYAACDVYATCSLSEGFNLPLLESQRYGKPVVAFDIGPHKEIVKSGYLIEPMDVEEFARKLIFVLNDNKTGKTSGGRICYE